LLWKNWQGKERETFFKKEKSSRYLSFNSCQETAEPSMIETFRADHIEGRRVPNIRA